MAHLLRRRDSFSSCSSSSDSSDSEAEVGPGTRYFYLKSKMNDMVLDLSGHGHERGTPVVMWPRKEDNVDNQLWFMDPTTKTIRSKEAPHMCLDLDEESERLQIHEYDPQRKNQRLKFKRGRMRFRKDRSHVLDIAEGNPESGARICKYEWHGGDNQRFQREFEEPRYFYIKSRMHGKVLDARDGEAGPGAAMVMAELRDGADSQLWYEDRQGHLRSKHGGLLLDFDDEGRLRLNERQKRGGKRRQRWCIRDDCVVNSYNPDLVLDIRGADEADGAEVLAYKFHGNDNQRWERHFV